MWNVYKLEIQICFHRSFVEGRDEGSGWLSVISMEIEGVGGGLGQGTRRRGYCRWGWRGRGSRGDYMEEEGGMEDEIEGAEEKWVQRKGL